MKAKKVFTMYGKYSDIVTYEYRGMKYDVEYAKNHSYCVTPAYIQHRDAQAKIDEAIDNPKPKKEYKYEGSAQEGFDLFWEYVNGDGE